MRVLKRVIELHLPLLSLLANDAKNDSCDDADATDHGKCPPEPDQAGDVRVAVVGIAIAAIVEHAVVELTNAGCHTVAGLASAIVCIIANTAVCTIAQVVVSTAICATN